MTLALLALLLFLTLNPGPPKLVWFQGSWPGLKAGFFLALRLAFPAPMGLPDLASSHLGVALPPDLGFASSRTACPGGSEAPGLPKRLGARDLRGRGVGQPCRFGSSLTCPLCRVCAIPKAGFDARDPPSSGLKKQGHLRPNVFGNALACRQRQQALAPGGHPRIHNFGGVRDHGLGEVDVKGVGQSIQVAAFLDAHQRERNALLSGTGSPSERVGVLRRFPRKRMVKATWVKSSTSIPRAATSVATRT